MAMREEEHIGGCVHPCDSPAAAAHGGGARPGRAVAASVYRTKIAGHCRVVTVSWCRDPMAHAFAVSIADDGRGGGEAAECRVELRPWQFWRRAGSRRVLLGGGAAAATPVRVLWDLRHARFGGAAEPRCGYYVAVAAAGEVALLLGDMRKEAHRRAGCGAAAIDAVPVARQEHVFGKRRFAAKARFHDQGAVHDISIECGGDGDGGGGIAGSGDSDMTIRIDGEPAVQVRHLQWKFRGNQSLTFSRAKVEVYWDVHDWLFSAGTRPALFIFRPIVLASASAPAAMATAAAAAAAGMIDGGRNAGLASAAAAATGFCLYLYAWKVE